MDNRQEGLQPPREPLRVSMGEWIRPLAGITENSDSLRGSDFRTKIAPLDLQGQKLDIEMNATGFDPIPRLRIITSMGEEDVSGKDAESWEKRSEIRLFSLSVITADEKEYPDGLPIGVSLMTPGGEVYTNRFISSEGEAAYVDMQEWKKQGDEGNENHFLLFPEIEQVLERVQIRFDPIGEKK